MPSVSIVMPAYNAALFLPRSLPAALAAARGAPVIVVDPGSNDGTPELAEKLGAKVLRLGHRAGPALARNRGVELVETDVVLFIDADCVCHLDVVERVAAAFAEDPELVSVTGSYDVDPPERNFFSQYMNLRHHFVHQQAKRQGASFWAGCGAVKTSVFRKIRGFDAEQFPIPMIEDIELSLRLKPEGNTALDPKLQVTHLKRWSMRGVIETDIKCRAIPWGKLILESGELPNDLNLAWPQRVAAALAPLVLLSVVAAPLLVVSGHGVAGAVSLLPLSISALLQRRFTAFFLRLRGPATAVGAYLFHQVHLSYSAATMAILTARHLLSKRSRKAAPVKSSG